MNRFFLKYERTFVINRVILSYNPQNFNPLSECTDTSQLIHHKKGTSESCLELYQTSWGRSTLKNGRQAEIPPFQGEKGPGFICARRVVIPSIDYPHHPLRNLTLVNCREWLLLTMEP